MPSLPISEPNSVSRSFVLSGVRVEVPPPAPGLYIISTPIGNLGDITVRALSVLAAADIILAEDTRVTRVLLSRYGISAPMAAYHEFSDGRTEDDAVRRLAAGQVVALVSDAGTPLISDPGYRLVQKVLAAGEMVTALPGPSAVLTALTLSGLPTDSFYFEGFLPSKRAARRARLETLRAMTSTVVLFEAPHRLRETLADAAEILGERPAAVARELTKLHETVIRAPLPEIADRFAAGNAPKGEIVVVIAPAPAQTGRVSEEVLDAVLTEVLPGRSVKDAVALATAQTGVPRREVYARAVALSGQRK
ncbi:MAG: 16S rRNA (cytidine(1402)-2'-O)-methyltransferase [Methylobacteriaceae bacterium]|jgi:16S rRNA (cytidine1402-2'-O)-methyltransferase|nr:16S rRNA (cytidine(1402)-2'-O)-methyltransferase [Methylobacteriaceae bacterium]